MGLLRRESIILENSKSIQRDDGLRGEASRKRDGDV